MSHSLEKMSKEELVDILQKKQAKKQKKKEEERKKKMWRIS